MYTIETSPIFASTPDPDAPQDNETALDHAAAWLTDLAAEGYAPLLCYVRGDEERCRLSGAPDTQAPIVFVRTRR